ncbi:MAG TPA: ATP-dependent DNA ligase [Terracidiphilus sp.]|nr:ATP-dependent DNA ligase [Terracidiphilus sp.]
MNLAVNPPVPPMLAKRVERVPAEGEWIFEPKWDGFRVLVFRDSGEILIQSRDERPLNRYFPEILEPLRKQLPVRCVLDGELVIAREGRLDFDALQLRLHPAELRVRKLATETPSSIVFFDVLCTGSRDLRALPFEKRRAVLEQTLSKVTPPIHITPATRDRKLALSWFRRFEGAGLDGVMAKATGLSYQPDKREMLKIKHDRDCDCVVAGFRWYRENAGKEIGSFLLGLFDDAGSLQHVGVCSGFSAEQRREFLDFVAPWRRNALAMHPWREWAEAEAAKGTTRMPGVHSRWSRGKDLAWEPLRPELVAEVAYDHLQGDRFRHVARFRRWRRDKRPQDCTYAQLEVVAPEELKRIFARG